MKKKILRITQTAMLIALLVLLQAFTKAGGQFVTGSCVNAVLAVSVLFCGLCSGVIVAAASPFFAFLLGVGPQFIAVIPAIAVGNVVFVLILYFFSAKKNVSVWRQGLCWLCAACGKALTLYLLAVQLLSRILPLAEKQITTITAMFSWPQLVTALIGGGVALFIVPILRKAFRR